MAKFNSQKYKMVTGFGHSKICMYNESRSYLRANIATSNTQNRAAVNQMLMALNNF